MDLKNDEKSLQDFGEKKDNVEKQPAMVVGTTHVGILRRIFHRHGFRADHFCPHRNIYHCATHKTASQWIRAIFNALHSHTAMSECSCEQLPETINDFRFIEPFPQRTFVTGLYISFNTYRTIPKPKSYKTFYIMRDPRDIVVSYYFSVLFSHPLMGDIAFQRGKLSEMSEQEGLLYVIEHLDHYGTFDAQRDWIERCDDPNAKIFRYEDLVGNEQQFLTALLRHCNVPVSQEEIQSLVQALGFKAITGRENGNEDTKQHLRKGVAGDWHNHFDKLCHDKFANVTGDLLLKLGYEE